MLYFMKNLLFSLVILSAIATDAQQVVRGPYLQLPTDNSIVIRWRTDIPTGSKISYVTDLLLPPTIVEDTTSKTEHEIQLTGLSPYTKYYYWVENATSILSSGDNHYFTTNPLPGTVQPIRTWIIGDFGKGNQSQLDVMQSYIDHNGAKNTDVWLWMGDNAYQDGTDNEYQTNVFDQYDSIMPYMPFYPTPGNHDYNSMGNYIIVAPTNHEDHTGAYYDMATLPENGEAGGLASGTEAFYSFDYGNVHYISLNSEIQNSTNSNDDMEDWLNNDLTQNTKDWTIAYWHQAPYSKGSHDSDDFWELHMKGMREDILPILESYGVDLVLCGHSHNYERSYLMKGHYDNSSNIQPSHFLDASSGDPNLGESYAKFYGAGCTYEGTIYSVMGNSGSKTSPGDDEGLNHPVMYISDAENAVGSLVIDIHGDTLRGTYMRATGQVVDEFEVIRYESCDASGINENVPEKDITVKVFSNHETGEFKIRFDLIQSSSVYIQLTDMTGKVVFEKDFGVLSAGDHYHTIDGRNLGIGPGIYNFAIYSHNNRVTKKLFMLK